MKENDETSKGSTWWVTILIIIAVLYWVFSLREDTSGINTSSSQRDCHPSYSGCLKIGAGDYDCRGGSGNGPNYTGRVRVTGSDVFGLDRDGDGVGCE